MGGGDRWDLGRAWVGGCGWGFLFHFIFFLYINGWMDVVWRDGWMDGRHVIDPCDNEFHQWE